MLEGNIGETSGSNFGDKEEKPLPERQLSCDVLQWLMYFYRPIIFATSTIYSGVVPQQPPTIPAPASIRAFHMSGKIRRFHGINGVSIIINERHTGIRLGNDRDGEHFFNIADNRNRGLIGPTEQFTPTASAPAPPGKQ